MGSAWRPRAPAQYGAAPPGGRPRHVPRGAGDAPLALALLVERPLDREHVTRRLDAGVQRLLVVRERRAGELAVARQLVAGEEERLAAVGRADEVVRAVAVFGDDHAAVGRDLDVVRPVGI